MLFYRGRLVSCSLVVALLTPALAVAQPIGCSDGSQCTTGDACMADGSCGGVRVANGTPCNNFNQCAERATCQDGRCVSGAPVLDGTPCGHDTYCASYSCQSGFCSVRKQNDGESCDDHNLCTTHDRCQFGFCSGDRVTCADTDHDLCTIEICNPQTGKCGFGIDITCDGACQTGTCDPLTGSCPNHKPDGTACDDYNGCTQIDECLQGVCLGHNPPTPTVTNTPTLTDTPTPVTPSPTPTRPLCRGDCDHDGRVGATDLIQAIRIAFGLAAPDACARLDANIDGTVTVDELVHAVSAALHGCSG